MRMPPLAVSVPDTAAAHLISDWIKSLKASGIHGGGGKLPEEFRVRAYPNPFNPQTRIVFDLPRNGHVLIEIYNLQGIRIATLSDSVYSAGSHLVVWDGKNSSGQALASGLYFYRITSLLQTRRFQQTGKLVLMR